MKLSQGLLTLLLAFLGMPVFAQIPCRYEVAQVFQGPDCGIFGNSPTVARAISPNGQYVCGYYSPCGGSVHQSFYWTQATGMVDIPMPANTTSLTALDVNDAGQVCGGCDGGTFSSRGFIYTIATGQFRFVQSLAEGPCQLNAINNAGVACGLRCFDSRNVLTTAIIRSPNGAITDLGPLNALESIASDISEDGVVVGWTDGIALNDERGFIYEKGNITYVPPVAPNGSSRVFAINSSHVVIGRGYVPRDVWFGGYQRAFVDTNGALTIIEPPSGVRHSTVNALNDQGMVGGRFSDPPEIPFLWQNGATYELNPLVVNGDIYDLTAISAMSSAGRLLAFGDINGQSVGVLLDPVHRPQGDVDNNCRTDIDDLVSVIVEWGKTKSAADLNGDGIVDVLDLVIVILNWST